MCKEHFYNNIITIFAKKLHQSFYEIKSIKWNIYIKQKISWDFD